MVICFINIQTILPQVVNFSGNASFITGGNPRSVAVADFNNDSKVDIFTANYGGNSISALLNTTAPGSIPIFSGRIDFTAGTSPGSAASADFNGEGKPDIVVVNVADGTASILINTTPSGASTPSFSAKTDFPTGAAPVWVATGDINGDGKPDIVTTNAGDKNVSVLLNTTTTGASTPTFSIRTDFAAIYSPHEVVVSDINGDGKQDIVVADYYAKNVSVFINTTTTGASTPTFAARKDFLVGQYTASIAVGDVNKDGKVDIVAANDGDNIVSVLLNTTTTGDTTASFSYKTDFTTGNAPSGVAIRDLDGDGRIDIVTTNKLANTVSVLLNTTTTGDTIVSFSAKTDYPTGTNPSGITIADINNDGKPDIITANYSGNSVSVLFDSSVHPPVSLFDSLAAMYLQNAGSELVLSVQSIDYNTKVNLGNKKEEYQNEWFIEMDESNPTFYRLKNLYSSKVMSDSSDGSIIVKGETNDDNQKWILINAGNDKWKIENVKTGKLLTLINDTITLAVADNTITQLWSIAMINPDYAVPVPKPINTGKYMIGAEMCNLWDITTRPDCWNQIAPYPDRKPVTGWFKEGSPEVMDWDIKIAVDNGINFFMPCWYRSEASVGKPEVKGVYDQWIDGLAKAKYKNYTKFMLIWINNSMTGLYGGISDKNDFINNLAPYFINHYFKNPDYLLIDGKPVISFFDAQSFIQECGGVSNAADAIAIFRQMVKDAGFKDLIFMGQWCSGDYIAHNNSDWKSIGADYSNAYHWPTFAYGAMPAWPPNGSYLFDEQILAAEQYCWDGQAKYSVIPNMVTCTMGWDSRPWGGRSGFRLTPDSFTELLDSAKSLIDRRNQNNLESYFVALDNWDEFGEGHYIYPTEQYGFGYLNSVKQTFGIITSINKENDQIPTNFSLSQNYPNPFNPSTVIKYSIPQSGFVTLKVYNLLGQEVAGLVNQEQKPGNYNVNFDASDLASGVYMYRLQSGDFSYTKKMVFLK